MVDQDDELKNDCIGNKNGNSLSLTVTLPNVLVSHPSLPAKTVRELIAFARARPGELQFATGGVGANQHLAMELFLNETGTPREIVSKLHAGVVHALQDPVIRKRLVDDGAEPTPSSTPDEVGAFIRAELAKWAKVVKNAGIQAE